MRKIIFLIISIGCCGISYADLGQIQVNSYLSQKLNAAIPITKLPVDADYGNISIGLANHDKFKSSGLTFNPELGYLLFKVIHNGNSAYLRITSSKPINSPVLTFLLHYKLDNDDFYRQYTILLDPLENVIAAPVAGTTAQKPIIVYNSNQRPIPISHKPRVKTPALATNVVANPVVSFIPDYSSQFVKEHLANFNKEQFSYTTNKGDTLYIVARFLQLMYPKANLTLNQIIVGLGLENYNDLSKPEYAYPAGIEILLAKPENIVKISASDADAYLWDVSLNDGARTGLLQKMAGVFDDELQINSSMLFAGNYVRFLESPVIASAPKIAPPVVKNNTASSLDFIFGFKYAILAVVLGGLIVLLLLTRLRKHKSSEYILAVVEPKKEGLLSRLFKRKSALATQNNVESVEPLEGIDNDITINIIKPKHELSTSDREEIRNKKNTLADKTVEQSNVNSVQTPLTPEVNEPEIDDELPAKAFNNVDNELIATLEQILTFDDSREDIRYKLLELYLGASQFAKAHKVHGELSERLDEDDPLRKNIIALCERYDFENLDFSGDAQALVHTDLSAGKPEASASIIGQDSNRSLEFTSSSPLASDDVIKQLKPEPATLEFSAIKIAPVADSQFVAPDYHSEDSRRSLDFASFTTNNYSASAKPDEAAMNIAEPSISITPVVNELVPPSIPDEIDKNKPIDQIEFSVPDLPEVNSESLSALPELSALDDDSGLLMDNLDEKINLAKMYYHIDEHAKAFELLTEIINNPTSKLEARQYAAQLINDLGLHG